MNRLYVFAVPFALSSALSLSTMGRHVYWQDSGLFLMAIHQLGVVYPPGSALYIFLAKLWTLLFSFLDFTYAVHLFSAACAASAAGILALALSDLLKGNGPLFGLKIEESARWANWSGAATGCFWATGYTFWFTAIYAKGYALYYLVLVLLIWRLIRADESGRPRDFTLVSILIGFAWACHPSAVLLGPALVAFVLVRARGLGWKGVTARGLLAAACAIGPSIVLLPIFSARNPWLALGQPRTPMEALRYLSAHRFSAIPGVYGWESSRANSFGQFLWEEFLGVGLVLVATGLIVMGQSNRRWLFAILLWLVPYATVTILFKLEGQHDCWFVAAWLPLYLAVGVGLRELASRARRHARWVMAGTVVVAIGWAVLVNGPLLNLRQYDLAEIYGKIQMDHLESGAVVLLAGDDSNAICGYLQQVRGERRDLILVTNTLLFDVSPDGRWWYDERLLAAHDFLRRPDYLDPKYRSAAESDVLRALAAAFLNANAESGHAMYTELAVPQSLIRDGYTLIPAGTLWKMVPRSAAEIDPSHWQFSVRVEEVLRQNRRERGQFVDRSTSGLAVRPEAYETRLVRLLLQARRNLEVWQVQHPRIAPR